MYIGLLTNEHCILRLQASTVEYTLNGDVTHWSDSRQPTNPDPNPSGAVSDSHGHTHGHGHGHFVPMGSLGGDVGLHSGGGLEIARQ